MESPGTVTVGDNRGAGRQIGGAESQDIGRVGVAGRQFETKDVAFQNVLVSDLIEHRRLIAGGDDLHHYNFAVHR